MIDYCSKDKRYGIDRSKERLRRAEEQYHARIDSCCRCVSCYWCMCCVVLALHISCDILLHTNITKKDFSNSARHNSKDAVLLLTL